MRALRILAALLLGAATLTVPATPAAAADLVRVEAESLTVVSATAPVEPSRLLRGRWSGGRQLWLRAGRAGDSVTVSLPPVTAGQYDIGAVLTRAPDYGRCASPSTG